MKNFYNNQTVNPLTALGNVDQRSAEVSPGGCVWWHTSLTHQRDSWKSQQSELLNYVLAL
jgi:hypothetical protein